MEFCFGCGVFCLSNNLSDDEASFQDLFEDEEALQQWQAAPSLSKEYEAEAMGNTNQVRGCG